MKPDAPAEIRGPFKPIETTAPGIQISEILPLHAKIADKFSLVRSCYHTARGGARHRLADDADRPAVHRRRQHAARRLRGRATCAAARPTCRRTWCCRELMGRRRRNLPNGQDARLPGQGARSVRARSPTRRKPNFRVPDLLPPAEIGDGPARPPPQDPRASSTTRSKNFEASENAAAAGQQLPVGVPADDQPAGPRGVRPVARSRQRSASATA